jgi:predicted amino acid-binding ACT domain protein
MNRYEQQMYKDISKLANAMEKLVKTLDIIVKLQNEDDRKIEEKNKTME